MSVVSHGSRSSTSTGHGLWPPSTWSCLVEYACSSHHGLYVFHRERMMDSNLFDSYPDPLPLKKFTCLDPVLGHRLVGCYNRNMLENRGFTKVLTSDTMTQQLCIERCQSTGYPYAALFNGDSCYCGTKFNALKANVCDCRKRCKGDRSQLCGSKRKVKARDEHCSLFRTNFCTRSMKKARTVDGTCNNLSNTVMGSRLYRFGRNFHYNYTVLPKDQKLLEPNPRLISRRLMKRDTFKPARWLNLFAVAWVQFMVHDWFDHGRPIIGENQIKVPLAPDDPLYSRFNGNWSVDRTHPDHCKEDPTRPLSFQNHVTHWWDASQIYGSDEAKNRQLRSKNHGKLKVDDEGFLPLDPDTNIEITGFSDNWWVGLSLMHNVFTREHNTICDMLLKKHPDWADQKLYDTARLINSALIAKIHVTEWTPTVLNETFVNESVKIEWFGTLSPMIIKYLVANNITLNPGSIHGNIGFPSDFGAENVPFTLTEEFVSVYRFHSLLPDIIEIRSMETGAKTGNHYTLPNFAFGNAAKLFDNNEIKDILYTFGTENAGALVLNNFPATTTDMIIPTHQGQGLERLIDLAAIDVIRDRERGIPRYNKFRELLKLKTLTAFEDFDVTPAQVQLLKTIYNNDINSVDLLVGSLAEKRPPGFAFGETAFQVFLLMANRRMMTDRFFNDDFRPEYYTQEGIDWVNTQTMKDVLLRAFPEVEKLGEAMRNAKTPFFDWNIEPNVNY
ncbi:hypothetical protein QZH41_011684 [Actinostola sp. cb2023]|nr:hypothetical protein QZH41_011684 [Actinostola sp. cb2023]